MNKKTISIAILTLAALGWLIFYTYGPASHAVGAKVNPASLKTTPAQNNSSGNVIALNTYHNKDFTENFYTIQFPQSWQLGQNQPGGYSFTFNGGSAKVETMDVPDNSTLELFVLSQDEPKLKSATPGYARVNYQKISVNGSDAYQLTYTSSVSGASYQTIRTYITGADKSGVITLTVNTNQVASMAAVFNAIINSFKWEK